MNQLAGVVRKNGDIGTEKMRGGLGAPPDERLNGYRIMAAEMIKHALWDLKDQKAWEPRARVDRAKVSQINSRAQSAARWFLAMDDNVLDADTVCEVLGLDRELIARKVDAAGSLEGATERKIEARMMRMREKKEARLMKMEVDGDGV